MRTRHSPSRRRAGGTARPGRVTIEPRARRQRRGRGSRSYDGQAGGPVVVVVDDLASRSARRTCRAGRTLLAECSRIASRALDLRQVQQEQAGIDREALRQGVGVAGRDARSNVSSAAWISASAMGGVSVRGAWHRTDDTRCLAVCARSGSGSGCHLTG